MYYTRRFGCFVSSVSGSAEVKNILSEGAFVTVRVKRHV